MANFTQGNMFGQTVPPYPQPSTPYTSNSFYPQLQQRNNVLPGRMVSRVEDVAIGEVPTDGSVGLFPQNDGSCIYAKSWTGDGSIKTIKFVPEIPTQETTVDNTTIVTNTNKNSFENENNVKLDEILNKLQTLDDIADFLTMTKSNNNQKNQNGSKENR